MVSDLFFYSMGSGSSGNSYYIGNHQYGFLIDAGISAKMIVKNLRSIDVDVSQIKALFITHMHKDHTQSMSVFGNRWNIPVVATQKVHSMVDEADYIHRKVVKYNRRNLEHGSQLVLRDFVVTSFFLPHDAGDNSGYIFEYKGVKIVLATDIGHVTDCLAQTIREADYLIIESNHDLQMLLTGPYPEDLKKRVASDYGHLCNEEAARVVAENAKDALRGVFLCHLSAENNTPSLAEGVMSNALSHRVPVHALKRKEPQFFPLD